MQKLLKIVLSLVAVSSWLYFYLPTLKIIYKDKVFNQKICSSPVTYSIKSIDSRFKLTDRELASAANEAVGLWESAIGKDLFEEIDSESQINIILKFDERQKVTNALGGLNGTIQIESSQIDVQKLNFKTLENKYAVAKSEYEYSLERYYALRGSSQSSLRQVEQELGRKQESLERLRLELNSFAGSLNQQVSGLNNKISTFNNLGQQRGEAFNEGEYVQDKGFRTIYVYEFEDRDKLIRLLAHEFGHALGLEHVSGTKSIMNEINGSTSTLLSPQDISELNRVCNNTK